MHIPEQLFSLPLLKDLRTQQLELIVRRGATTVLAASSFLELLFTVPGDRIFCVTSFAAAVLTDPLGGVCVAVGLQLDIGATSSMVCAAPGTGFVAAAGQPIHAFGTGCSIWCPPSSRVSVYVSLNTTATHSVTPSLTGLSFPRGSVAIG